MGARRVGVAGTAVDAVIGSCSTWSVGDAMVAVPGELAQDGYRSCYLMVAAAACALEARVPVIGADLAVAAAACWPASLVT